MTRGWNRRCRRRNLPSSVEQTTGIFSLNSSHLAGSVRVCLTIFDDNCARRVKETPHSLAEAVGPCQPFPTARFLRASLSAARERDHDRACTFVPRFAADTDGNRLPCRSRARFCMSSANGLRTSNRVVSVESSDALGTRRAAAAALRLQWPQLSSGYNNRRFHDHILHRKSVRRHVRTRANP